VCLTGRTPLLFAIPSKGVGIAKYLLDHGANPNKAKHDGCSPLHEAVISGLPLQTHASVMHLCAVIFLMLSFQFSSIMVWLSIVFLLGSIFLRFTW
jgi:ankyrin repeat protein